jgi:hypothetical protein
MDGNGAAGNSQQERTNRRGLLRAALGAAAATVGAGALLETQKGTAEAAWSFYESAQNSGNIAIEGQGFYGAYGVVGTCDNTAGAVGVWGQIPKGSGTGVIGSSDSGTGVSASSASGTGLYAATASSTGVALQAVADDSNTVPTSGVAAAVIGDGGANTGIYGTTSSGLAGATAIHGVVTNASPGLLSAGVWGESHGSAHQGAGVIGTHNGNGDGVYGSSQSGGRGVVGTSVDYYGVYADGGSGTGLYAIGLNSGISAYNSGSGVAIYAINNGASPSISASNSGSGSALTGTASTGTAIVATTSSGLALNATGSGANVVAAVNNNPNGGTALRGTSTKGIAIVGVATGTGNGLLATSTASGYGVRGQSVSGPGVDGTSTSGAGVRARVGTANKVALEVHGLVLLKAADGGGDSPVGQTNMAAGSTSQAVSSGAATASSIVLLTPLSDPGVRLFISARAAGSFTIGASAPLPAATAIQFLVIN